LRVALVLGGGNTVWDDFSAALDLGEFGGTVACNDAGVAYPGRLDAWVSLHAMSFKVWTARRAKQGLPPHRKLVAHDLSPTERRYAPACVTDYSDHRFPGQVHGGSSGLFALKVALIDLGFDKAVLCGVPMTTEAAHFFDDRPWTGAGAHKTGWREAMPQIKDRARSMSGWTMEQLGAPDAAWLTQ